MMRKTVFGMVALCAMTVAANTAATGTTAREAFLKQQAYQDVQRLAGQIDVLEANQEKLTRKLAQLEGGGGEIDALRKDVEAIRSDMNRLRTEMNGMHDRIVRDIVAKINAHNARSVPSAAPAPTEPTKTYTVRSGDTLSLVAQAFGTTVAKLKELNHLRSDSLRVGQALKVPDGGKTR